RNNKMSAVIDGTPQRNYDGIVSGWKMSQADRNRFPDFGKMSWDRASISFSPDSRHYAYAADGGGQSVLIYDGEERMKHPAIVNTPILFSPDSRHVAYSAGDGERQFVV